LSDFNPFRRYLNADDADRSIVCAILPVAPMRNRANARLVAAFSDSFAMFKRTIADAWRSFTILRTLVQGTARAPFDFWTPAAYGRRGGDAARAATPKSDGLE
jgi:hypothetical protein